MKKSVLKFFLVSLGLHFFIISIFLFKNSDFQESLTSILLVELISVQNNVKFEEKKVANKQVTDKKKKDHKKTEKNQIRVSKSIFTEEIKTEKGNLDEQNNNSFKAEKKIEILANESSSKKDKNLYSSEVFKSNSFTRAIYKIGSIKNPHPPYPLIARKKGWQGKLTLNVWVDTNGWVNEIYIKKSSGYKILDDVSLQTIKKWHFIPARSGDKNVKDQLDIPVKFVLSE